MDRRITKFLQQVITFFEQTSIKLKEAYMDKTDNNPNTAVWASSEKATTEKETEVIELVDEEQTVEQLEIVEYIIDMPENEVPVMYQGVAIYGSHLISVKFFNIVKHALECDDFLKEDIVKIIIFSPEQPVDQHGNPYFACYKPEAKLIALNLQQHFNGAVQLVKEVDGFMSLRGHIWYNMILSIFHELYHGLFIATDAEKDMSSMAEIEATCNDMADEALTAIAREYDIEPPAMGKEPFFGLRYMEFYIREIKDGKDSWCIRQDALHDGMNIHYDDERKEYIELFRSFIRYTHGADSDHKDPTWDQEPKPLMFLPETVPASEAVIDVQAEPVVAAQQAPAGVFHGAEADEVVEDFEDSLGLHDNAYTVEDYDTLPAEAANFNTQVLTAGASPIVENTVTARSGEIQCLKCWNVMTETMQFCGNCGTAFTTPTAVADAPPWPVDTPVQAVTAATAQHVIAAQPAGSITGHGGAPGQILPTNLPNHNLTPESFRTVVEQILFRLYAHLFNKCGYLGGMSNPCFDANGKWGVLEGVSVADIVDADRVLYAHDFLGDNIHKTMVPITDGIIRGFCTKKGMLPAYTVYFNANGDCIKRVLLPQNSWKEKVGVLSAPALRAQQGAIIAWIMDGDDNTTKKFRGRIENSVFNWS